MITTNAPNDAVTTTNAPNDAVTTTNAPNDAITTTNALQIDGVDVDCSNQAYIEHGRVPADPVEQIRTGT